MWEILKKWFGYEKTVATPEYEVRDISMDEVKRAISQFTKEKHQKVPLRILVNEQNEIDYHLLAPYLKGIPRQSYYMSRETYELFESQDMAQQLDQIQRAVDDFIDQEGRLPVLENDPKMKISYYKLRPYLKITPSIDTYLTAEENLITWKEPVLH